MSKEVRPDMVMSFINGLFSEFDVLCTKHGVHKLDSFGDCYIVVGGLIKTDEDGAITVQQGFDAKKGATDLVAFARVSAESNPHLAPPSAPPAHPPPPTHPPTLALTPCTPHRTCSGTPAGAACPIMASAPLSASASTLAPSSVASLAPSCSSSPCKPSSPCKSSSSSKSNFPCIPSHVLNLPQSSINGRYGDAVNTSSRMESTCQPGCIQVSETTYNLLDSCQRNLFKPTGGVFVKVSRELWWWLHATTVHPLLPKIKTHPPSLHALHLHRARVTCPRTFTPPRRLTSGSPSTSLKAAWSLPSREMCSTGWSCTLRRLRARPTRMTTAATSL
jgi:hypothetical protein